jgi:uncharacterized protein YhaN
MLQIASRQSAVTREAQLLREEDTRGRDLLVRELNAAGADTSAVAAHPFRLVLEFASEAKRQNESQAAALRALEDRLAKATSEIARKQKALDTAESQVKAWQEQWTAAIRALGLNPGSPFETLDAQINAIDELREVANRINDLRHERIEKIERDIAAFGNEVSQILHAIAPELAAQDPQDAVLELERRLTESNKAFALAAATDQKLADALERAEQCMQVQREARQSIDGLQNLHHVSFSQGL